MKTFSELAAGRLSESKKPRPKELARAMAERHGGDFEKDLRDYEWPRGVIVDRPDCFAIGYVTKSDAGEWAWFVKTAVGDLAQLLLHIPIPLSFIGFDREKTGKRKWYRIESLLRVARKMGAARGEGRGGSE